MAQYSCSILQTRTVDGLAGKAPPDRPPKCASSRGSHYRKHMFAEQGVFDLSGVDSRSNQAFRYTPRASPQPRPHWFLAALAESKASSRFRRERGTKQFISFGKDCKPRFKPLIKTALKRRLPGNPVFRELPVSFDWPPVREPYRPVGYLMPFMEGGSITHRWRNVVQL